LKREELRRDLDRIRAYYLDNGFLDIAVDEPEVQLDAERKKLRIIIRVQEGPQYRIGELSIKGNSLLSEAEVRGVIKSWAGGIFSREAAGRRGGVTDRYANETSVRRRNGHRHRRPEPGERLAGDREGRQAYINGSDHRQRRTRDE
jgi:outer membrane protein insertion porin family